MTADKLVGIRADRSGGFTAEMPDDWKTGRLYGCRNVGGELGYFERCSKLDALGKS